MSTKSTIACGPEFHFYTDLMDEECTYYLEMKYVDAKFVAKIEIPAHIWENIRTLAPVDLSLVNKTDDELYKMVEKEVDERIAQYNLEKDENLRGFLSFFGSALFGGADSPKEEQINKGIEYYTKERDKQQKIAERMKTCTFRREEE